MWIPISIAHMAIVAVAMTVFTWIAIQICHKIDFLDHPSGRKAHAQATPLCGGLVLWGALIALTLLGWLDLGLSTWDWLALCVMTATGFMDDRFSLRARSKAYIGAACAALLTLSHGLPLLKLAGVFPLFGMALPNTVYLTLPLLFLWFWFLPQAINLMDGVNGLVSGFTLLVLWFIGAPALLIIPVAVVFLFNYPKARLFLGDNGALMIGTVLAILTVKSKLPHQPNSFFLLFFYPMLDVCLVCFSRWRRKQPFGVGDRSHLHHRIADALGGKATWAVPILALGTLFGPKIAQQLGFLETNARWAGLLLFLAMLLAITAYNLAKKREKKPRFTEHDPSLAMERNPPSRMP